MLAILLWSSLLCIKHILSFRAPCWTLSIHNLISSLQELHRVADNLHPFYRWGNEECKKRSAPSPTADTFWSWNWNTVSIVCVVCPLNQLYLCSNGNGLGTVLCECLGDHQAGGFSWTWKFYNEDVAGFLNMKCIWAGEGRGRKGRREEASMEHIDLLFTHTHTWVSISLLDVHLHKVT